MLPSEAEPELSDRTFDLVQQSSALAAPLVNGPYKKSWADWCRSDELLLQQTSSKGHPDSTGVTSKERWARDFSDGNERPGARSAVRGGSRILEVAEIHRTSAFDAPDAWALPLEVYVRWAAPRILQSGFARNRLLWVKVGRW